MAKVLCALLVLGVLCCAGRVPTLGDVPLGVPVQTVEVTAEKYRFKPSEIRVTQGTVVRLVFRSLDIKHGVKIGRYGIDRDIPRKGQGSVSIEFYAREPGTYKFHCSKFCGLGHPWMKGKLIVEEK